MTTPTLAEIDAAIAKKKRKSLTLADINAAIAKKEEVVPELEDSSIGDVLVGAGDGMDRLVGNAESVMTAVSTPIAMAAGGYAGMGQAMNPFAEPGAGARTAAEVQEEWTYKPRSQEGRQNNKVAAEMAQKAIDMLNIPISYLGYAVELFTYETPEKAMETLQSIQEKGALKTVGDRVLESTDSPLLATAAEVVPQALAAGLSLATGGGTIARNAGSIGGMDVKGVKPTLEAVMKYQGPEKQRLAEMVQKGSDFDEIATKGIVDKNISGAENIPLNVSLALGANNPKLTDLKSAQDLVDKGFDSTVISPLNKANKTTRIKARQMVEIANRAMRDGKYAMDNTVGQVAGDALLNRYQIVKRANKKAGKALGDMKSQLQGIKDVDFDGAISQFYDDLTEMGVKFKDTDKKGNERIMKEPEYFGSAIEGNSAKARKSQTIISDVIRRMDPKRNINAWDIHNLKGFLDSQVSFDKSALGLPGKSERIIKRLRHEIDKSLDNKIPEYDAVNKDYSKTIKAMEMLTSISGKMDLDGLYSGQGVGVLLRRLMSNAKSRSELRNATVELDKVAKYYTPKTKGGDVVKFGEKLDFVGDDLDSLVLLTNELERYFKLNGRTSLQGIIDQSFGTAINAMADASTNIGRAKMAADVVGKVFAKSDIEKEKISIESLRKYLDDDALFESMRKNMKDKGGNE